MDVEKWVRRARMIESKLAQLESLKDGILEQLNVEREALSDIRTWLEEVDREVEIIPATSSSRLCRLLESLKGKKLSKVERKVIKQLVEEL